MKKLFSLLTLALLTMSAWAAADVTLNFTSNEWGLPAGSGAGQTTAQTYTNGTYTITLEASTKYYYNADGYLLFGKANSKLTLPAFDQAVEKIVVTGRSGASSGTVMNIYVDSTAVSTATTGSTGTNTYEIDENYQAAGTVYTLMVTSNHNAQVVKIEIYFAGNTPIEPEVAEVANIAEGNALTDDTEFIFTGSAVVCFKNNKNMWIRDNTGSVQVYGNSNFGDEFAKGVVITPNWGAKKATYNGMAEYTSLTNFTASNQTQTVEPLVRETLTMDNANEYVVLQNVTIDSTYTSGNKTNYVTNTGVTLRNNFSISFTPQDGVAYNIIGVVSAYNNNPQLYITEVEGYVAPIAQPNDLAEANVLPDNTEFTYANDVAATYQSGKYLFIRDEQGNSGLIFGDVNVTFETGDVLGADWSAKKVTYYGVPEFTNPQDVTNSGDKWEVAPYERQTLTTGNVNEYVIMKGLSVIAETDTAVSNYDKKYYNVADSMVIFDQFGVHPTFEEDKTYDIIGIATIHSNKPQLYIISVTEHEGTTPQPVEPEAGDYVKVTNTADLTSGEYLIVYETTSLAFDGGLDTLDAVGNSIAVEIVEGQLIKGGDNVDAAAFTYDAEAGTLKSASGYYIGRTSDANGLQSSTETAYTNTLSIDENGDADIVAEGGAYLRYNANENPNSYGLRFRYYKSSSYTGQQAIQLYKKVEGETPVAVRGDVDGIDGVTMDDLTALINYLLNDSYPINTANAAICDSLDSTEVNMDDLTALINYLLNGTWND